jgi:hypothetical protein
VQELILKGGVLFKSSLLVVLILMKKVWTSDINTLIAKTLDLSLLLILINIWTGWILRTKVWKSVGLQTVLEWNCSVWKSNNQQNLVQTSYILEPTLNYIIV